MKTPDRAQDRRLEAPRIADAALKVIGEQGLARFTSQAIAREVGVSDAALFRHFATKEDIVLAVIDRVEEILFADFPPAGADPIERLGLFFRRRIAVIRRTPAWLAWSARSSSRRRHPRREWFAWPSSPPFPVLRSQLPRRGAPGGPARRGRRPGGGGRAGPRRAPGARPCAARTPPRPTLPDASGGSWKRFSAVRSVVPRSQGGSHVEAPRCRSPFPSRSAAVGCPGALRHPRWPGRANGSQGARHREAESGPGLGEAAGRGRDQGRLHSRHRRPRKSGPEARALADTWFFETVVRVHRAGEGAPYNGLEPAGQDLGPAIAAADRSVDAGYPAAVEKLLADTVKEGVHDASPG